MASDSLVKALEGHWRVENLQYRPPVETSTRGLYPFIIRSLWPSASLHTDQIREKTFTFPIFRFQFQIGNSTFIHFSWIGQAIGHWPISAATDGICSLISANVKIFKRNCNIKELLTLSVGASYPAQRAFCSALRSGQRKPRKDSLQRTLY